MIIAPEFKPVNKRKILLVVDMQLMPFVWKDYGGKSLLNENRLLEKTKALIDKARKSQAPVYYVYYTESADSPRAEGCPLWSIHPEIAPWPGDRQIVKNHADSFLKTGLHSLLQKDEADTIVICGVQTEFCVDTTVKSAFSYGYHVVLAKDCHSTFDSDLLSADTIIAHHNAILEQFADIIPADRIDFE